MENAFVHNITIIYSDNRHEEYNLLSFGKKEITFGRSERCDIVIDSPIISRKHGRFELNGEKCTIRDTKSTNGIYVNGHRVSASELNDYTDIRIDDVNEPINGGVTMIYSSSNEASGWMECELKTDDETTIGRDSGCDIQIDHVTVSRIQASIRMDKNGKFILYPNAGSRTPMTVNGVPVTYFQALADRDIICIANTRLIYDSGKITYKTQDKGLELKAINISKAVKVKGHDKYIMDDTTLQIKPCEFVAIIGGSGSGKSTLMNCLNGFDKPTTGSVLVNGVDLYENFEVLKNVIGYVPQQDIVHENLTLYQMLLYVAKLRMSTDSTEEEYDARVREVIEMVELTGHDDTLIRSLSGGQKKRASIAVELIDDPSLFFLDEPSSGLDPGTEKSLMQLLQKMSRQGKTIITITHTTQNLNLCDKIIFLGTGGYMAYFGHPHGALDFFGVNDLVDAYLLVEKDPQGWEVRFNNSKHNTQTDMTTTVSDREYSYKKKSFRNQTSVLVQRYLRLLMNDKIRLAFLILQGPLIAFLLSVVAGGSDVFEDSFVSQQMLFCLSCAAIWVGLLNAIQEICKERSILRREYMSDLRLDAYIASKLCVESLMALVQSVLMMGAFAIAVGLPKTSALGIGSFLEMLITIFLVTVASSSLGLVVSSFAKNPDRAMVFAPILLIPQLLFSGMLFMLDGATSVVSWFCASRWSMEALGNIADCNRLTAEYYRAILTSAYKGTEVDIESMVAAYTNPMYNHGGLHLVLTWLILIFMIFSLCCACMLLLRSLKRDKR